MKLWMLLILLGIRPAWLTDLDEAKEIAVKEEKLILLNFSGSDWCAPCIRQRKEIFGSADFADYAEKHLVLVNADFPRLKKNQLSSEQKAKNELLAERYNSKGIFPFTVLLNAKGEVIRSWDHISDVHTFLNQSAIAAR